MRLGTSRAPLKINFTEWTPLQLQLHLQLRARVHDPFT